jgi:hypothetical protein
LRWDRRISYYGLLDVKVVVQIAFTVLGRIFLQMTPWCTMYSIFVPLLSPVPTPVSEPSSQIPFPPNEADNDDGGQGLRRWAPVSLSNFILASSAEQFSFLLLWMAVAEFTNGNNNGVPKNLPRTARFRSTAAQYLHRAPPPKPLEKEPAEKSQYFVLVNPWRCGRTRSLQSCLEMVQTLENRTG